LRRTYRVQYGTNECMVWEGETSTVVFVVPPQAPTFNKGELHVT
jgi:hypothetical protein